MRIEIHHYHHVGDDIPGIQRLLDAILRLEKNIMATQAQLAADLNTVTAQIAKIGTETGKTLQQVTDLQKLLAAGGNTTPEVDAAMESLKAQAQLTDDLVPDAAP
jgi:hypothetical protein